MESVNLVVTTSVVPEAVKVATTNSFRIGSKYRRPMYYDPGAGSPRPHAPTGDGTYTYTYDANGNMVSRSDGRTFEYDYRNMLTSVTDSGVTKGTYVYDAAGVRVKKVENGITTYYVGDYYEEQWEGGAKTHTTKYYTVNGKRFAKRRDGTVSFIHSDYVGSTSRVSDASGNLQHTIVYKPYGEDAYSDDGGAMHYRFTGKEKDAATGLYYYGARYYDPALGMFTAVDPAQFDPADPQTLNPYAYARNNPVRFIDPSGESIVDTVVDVVDTVVSWSAADEIRDLYQWEASAFNELLGGEPLHVRSWDEIWSAGWRGNAEHMWQMLTDFERSPLIAGMFQGGIAAATIAGGVEIGGMAKLAQTALGARALTAAGSGLAMLGANMGVSTLSGKSYNNTGRALLDFGAGATIGGANTFTAGFSYAGGSELGLAGKYPIFTGMPKGSWTMSMIAQRGDTLGKVGRVVSSVKINRIGIDLANMQLGEKMFYQYWGTTTVVGVYAGEKRALYGGRPITITDFAINRFMTGVSMMILPGADLTPVRVVIASTLNAIMTR